MKRILSIIMAAAMLLSALCLPSFAGDSGHDYSYTAANGVHFTDAFAASGNVSAEYDENYRALKITPNAASEGETSVTFTADGAVFADTASLALLILFPTTSCYEGASITVGRESLTAHTGYSFEAYGAKALSGADASVELSFSSEIAKADSFYVYGICDTASDEYESFVSAANGMSAGITADMLDKYDADVYTRDFWDGENGGVVYNESFMPVRGSDGTLEPIQLMYDADQIVSVRNSYLNTEYTYGVDYTIEDGKLVILDGSAIHIYNYSDVYSNTQLNASWRKAIDGRYVYCGQLNMYFVGYFNVTYTTSSSWDGPVPESKGYLLHNSVEKLRNNETVKLLSVGDSLAGGANASADLNVAPYAEIWCDMVASKVALMYPDADVQRHTIAQGGATASLCVEKMSDIIAYDPDIIFIEFGTNDCMQGDAPDGYINTLNEAITAIKANIPGCDIVLVAPIISNPLFFDSNNFYAYADALYALEQDGVAVANVTSELQYLLTRKDYIDMTGDYLCHPNDFVSRVFVQTITDTLTESSVDEYKADLSTRLQSYRYADEFSEANLASVNSYIAEGKLAISASADRSAAMSAYLAAAKKIDAVPTLTDEAASATLDGASLIFNSLRSYDAVGTFNNVNTSFEVDESALLLNVASARGAYQNINYSACTIKANADDYDYAVVTLKVPTTVSANAKATVFTFTAGGQTLASDTVTLTKNGAYNSYIIDLSAKSGWTGEISNLKITPYASCVNGDRIYLSSVCLCADYESARDTAIDRQLTANGNAEGADTFLVYNDAEAARLGVTLHSNVLLGDINADGKLNAKDALKLRKYISGIETSIADSLALDMNLDGEIGIADSLVMTKTLAGILAEKRTDISDADISYSTTQEAAEITANVANPTVSYTRADGEAALSADMFRYLTVCAKNADGSSVGVTVKLYAGDASEEYEISFSESEFFQAETAKFFALGQSDGEITRVDITFNVDKGDTFFLDSLVFTSTITAAHNAEIVRVGAANLI